MPPGEGGGGGWRSHRELAAHLLEETLEFSHKLIPDNEFVQKGTAREK